MVDLTFINAALTRIGEQRISSLTDKESTAGTIADANYEIVVRDELSRYPWRWATQTVNLGPPLAAADDAYLPWGYSRTLSLPIIRMRSVRVAGLPLRYEVRYGTLLTDQDDTGTIEISAVVRPEETYWPPEFGELITLRMQQIFLRAIGERYSEADSLEKPIQTQRGHAHLRDAQAQSAIPGMTSPTLEARRARA